MTVLEDLFNRRWIVRDYDKELYYRVREQLPKYQKFLQEKLDYPVIITPQLIKLEKIPGKAESWMGIQDFSTKLEYQFLCLILMFLEDLDANQQFVLSELTEYLQVQFPKGSLKWENYTNRRLLIRTLKYCFQEQLILKQDGAESEYLSDQTQDVLYENTGLSRYFVRRFSQPITDLASLNERASMGEIELDEERGYLRRQRIYRKLVMEMAVYKTGQTDEDFIYIKNYRRVLEQDFNELFQAQLHIHKNSAYIVLDEEASLGTTFPDRSNLSEVILLVNRSIRDRVRSEQWQANDNDQINVSQLEFLNLITECKQRYQAHFTKKLKDASSQEFFQSVTDLMQQFNMIKIDEVSRNVTIFPICGKIIGLYEDEVDEEGAGDDNTNEDE